MVALIESYLELQGRRSAHGDEILEHLSSINRAPGGKNPKGTLRTTLAQLEKRGRIRNIGRNRWRINRGRPASSGRRSEAVPEAEAASA